MKLLITDVSVLFDLYTLKVLNAFFELEFEICITLFVYEEIVNTEQLQEFETFKQNGKLNVLHIDQVELEQILQFKTKRYLKSLPDKTILWKALQLKCPILTCDEKLRQEAKDNGIEVHGSIWVILEFWKQRIVEKNDTITLLEKLKQINLRLPVSEIDKLIRNMND